MAHWQYARAARDSLLDSEIAAYHQEDLVESVDRAGRTSRLRTNTTKRPKRET